MCTQLFVLLQQQKLINAINAIMQEIHSFIYFITHESSSNKY